MSGQARHRVPMRLTVRFVGGALGGCFGKLETSPLPHTIQCGGGHYELYASSGVYVWASHPEGGDRP